MKMILFFLLIGYSATAQKLFPQSDSAKISILEGLPTAQPFDTARKWVKITGSQVYIVSDKDLYDYFGYNTSMKFREFDFLTSHIMGEFGCRQCMTVCRHEEGSEACHRNRCNYSWVWWKRNNEKAFRELPVIVRPGHDDNLKGQQLWLDDTLVKAADTSKWLTTGFGDCHATFTYKLYEDIFTSTLLLFEHNYWGGCRAGGAIPATILFRMPDHIKKYYKHTILEERRNRE